MEIWKEIDGTDGYFISSTGRVKNDKGRILSQYTDTSGYSGIKLVVNGVVRNLKIHRLVAKAYIENPSGKEQVNHLDGNKKNNCVDNLEWCTQEENLWHAMHVLHTSKEQRRVRKPVRCIETGVVYESVSQAGREVGINKGSISHCCKNKTGSTRGKHWEYVE